MKTLYVVGRNETNGPHTWELQGIFDTEKAAKENCRDWTYCYFTMNLNESAPHETIVASAIYPKGHLTS